MCPHGVRGRSVHRGQEATGGLVESESSVLPGRVLTESCQTLHVAPDRAWIRLVLLRQRVCLHGLLARQIESLHNRIKHRVARRTELQGDGPLEQSAIDGRVGVERRADSIQRCRPRVLNRRSHVPAPEASHVLKTPDHVIRADGAKQEEIQGQGGGSDIAVPENEPAEQAGMRGVRGIIEVTIAVHEVG
jgi:hypothetical protein